MTAIDLAILDMAGTTVRDAGQVPDAFLSALAMHDVQAAPEDVHAVRGASKRRAILDLLPAGEGREARAEQVFQTFRAHLARRYSEGVEAIPGAQEAIAQLRAGGIRVALNTGFDRDTTKLLLAALGWGSGVVDAVVCGDEVPQGRPAPYLIFRCMEATGACSTRRVAVAGDTALDLQAGSNAGVLYNIGVLSGAHGRAELAAQPHTHIVGSVAELPGILLQ